MSWLNRRPSLASDELVSMAYAAEFAAAVDRTFPIDDAAIDRIRGRVLGAFIEAAPAPAVPRRGRPAAPRLGRPIQQGLTIALAATVGLFAFGSVAVQAQPGGPFYPLKLAIETATLPSVDAPAGWEARLGRLQRRIDESLAAQRSGNQGALASALGEYRAELAGLNGALADPVRRSGLISAVADDLAIVVGLEAAYPSEAARLLVADMRAIVGSPEPNGSSAGPGGQSIEDPDAENDAIEDPHTSGSDPHAGGATGNPHADDATGNPHTDGSTGNPHGGGSTGNPHSDGGTRNPHSGSTGNPHAAGSTGNPHPGGASSKPHGGKGSPKASLDSSEA